MKIDNEPPPYQNVGSKLKIKESSLKSFIVDLISQCKINYSEIHSLQELISAHNHYVTYVISLLNFTSGHRAVNDPFHDSACFFPQYQAFIITVKV